MATTRRTLVFGTAALAAAHQAWLSHGEPAAPAPRLDPIPVFDLREADPARHALARREQVQGLAQACIGPLTPAARLALSGADALARRWLVASGTPYADELARIAASTGVGGVHLLNASKSGAAPRSPPPRRRAARRGCCARWTGPSTASGGGIELWRQRGRPATSPTCLGPAPWGF